MPEVLNEQEDEGTNDLQGKTKLETRHQEESNHITGKLMRRRSSQPEKQKEPDSQSAEITTGTGKQ